MDSEVFLRRFYYEQPVGTAPQGSGAGQHCRAANRARSRSPNLGRQQGSQQIGSGAGQQTGAGLGQHLGRQCRAANCARSRSPNLGRQQGSQQVGAGAGQQTGT